MKKITLILLISVLFFSCTSSSSDPDGEIKSSANYIESFSYPGVNSVQVNIINELKTVHVLTKQNISVEPIVKPSKGASVKKEGTEYVITAENGETRKYSVDISYGISKENKFESWNNKGSFDYVSDLNWASGNVGITTALSILGRDISKPENYPTQKTESGYEGKAVVLETKIGGTIFGTPRPILSGNFFLGKFNTNKMASDELAATEFGKLYFAKPKSVKGWYKYEEGTGDGNDSCDIYAAFYQASDEPLTAKDNLDENSLAYDRVENCTTTDGFQPFELNFDNYKSEPDFDTYNYKLVITFASSKGGATYEGKPGSKLTVDEVVIEDYP